MIAASSTLLCPRRRFQLPAILSALSFAALSLLAAGGCADRSKVVSLAGATSFHMLSETLAAEYMKANPGTRVMIQPMDSAAGIQAVLSGVVQIGISDFATLPPEATGLQAVEVARDEIAVIVHPANRVGNLGTAQIRDIFSGVLRNWKDAGGKEHGIDVVVREKGSGTRTSFEAAVGGVGPNDRVILQDTSGAVLATVAANENAIGYVSHGLADARVKALAVDGVSCDSDPASGKPYPISRPIMLLTKGTPSEAAADFIRFVRSDDGRRIIREHGLLSP